MGHHTEAQAPSRRDHPLEFWRFLTFFGADTQPNFLAMAMTIVKTVTKAIAINPSSTSIDYAITLVFVIIHYFMVYQSNVKHT